MDRVGCCDRIAYDRIFGSSGRTPTQTKVEYPGPRGLSLGPIPFGPMPQWATGKSGNELSGSGPLSFIVHYHLVQLAVSPITSWIFTLLFNMNEVS